MFGEPISTNREISLKLKPSQGAGMRGRRRNGKSNKPDTVGWGEDCV